MPQQWVIDKWRRSGLGAPTLGDRQVVNEWVEWKGDEVKGLGEKREVMC